MANVSPATDKCINRRIVLKGGAALGAAGPALLRFFCLDPSANILYAANADEGYSSQQNTDTIVPFRIDQANGMLTPTGQVIKTNSPSTIVLARV